jgi:hypothetical protein
MEILINELSLNGQFQNSDEFIEKGLKLFISILRQIDKDKDMLFKKQNFWERQVTKSEKLIDVLNCWKSDEKIGFKDEITAVKRQISDLIYEPFWESSRKHNISDTYEYDGENINDSSVAEASERDKIVVSFIDARFSSITLVVIKNKKQEIAIDNLLNEKQYIEIAYNRKQMGRCEYFERKFELDIITLLENECRFMKIKDGGGNIIYKENKSNNYWYLDNLHKNHYEVFNHKGEHIGEANLKGEIDENKRDSKKNITL